MKQSIMFWLAVFMIIAGVAMVTVPTLRQAHDPLATINDQELEIRDLERRVLDAERLRDCYRKAATYERGRYDDLRTNGFRSLGVPAYEMETGK